PDHVDRARQVGAVERMAVLQQQDQFFEELAHLVGLGAGDADLIAADVDVGAGERLLDLAQVRVATAEQARHQVIARHDDVDVGVAHDGDGCAWAWLGMSPTTLAGPFGPATPLTERARPPGGSPPPPPPAGRPAPTPRP